MQDKTLKESLKTMLENRLQPKTDENDVNFRLYSVTTGDAYVLLPFPCPTLTPCPHFSPLRPTKLVAHGNKGLTDVDLMFSQAYREAGIDCNLIGIDWRELEGSAHVRVVQAGIQAGRLVGLMMKELGLKVKDIHAIGFSYGAHVVGNASKEIQRMGIEKIPRITALDPGRHGFNQESSDKIRLTKDDADLVDVIHTSKIGFQEPLGHVDFFPNGGLSQACEGDGDKINFCDLQAGGGWEHQRAVQYYQESIEDSHKFLSWKGEDYGQFVEGNEEDAVSMGEHLCSNGEPHEGKYYLKTNGKKPFSCS